MKLFKFTTLFLFLFTVACGSSTVSEESFYKTYAEKMCSKKYECCGNAYSEDDFSTEMECINVIMKDAEEESPNVLLLPLKWNGTNAKTCLDYLTKVEGLNKSCVEQISNTGYYDESAEKACFGLYEGVLGQNQSCDAESEYSECKPGLYCHSEMKICQNPGSLGMPCSYMSMCGDNLFCGQGDICTAMPKLNESCELTNMCDQRFSSLFCHEGICRNMSNVGGTCAAGVACADGLFCNSNSLCDYKKESGQLCDSSYECKSSDCSSGACSTGMISVTEYICVDGGGTGGCTSGDIVCTGNMLMMCSGGSWVLAMDCAESGMICAETGGTANCM